MEIERKASFPLSVEIIQSKIRDWVAHSVIYYKSNLLHASAISSAVIPK